MKFPSFSSGSLVLLTAMFLGSQAIAAPAVQHIFSNGQPADANQVNQNFQELADRIEEIPVGPQGPQGAPGDKGDKGDPGNGVVEINFDPYRHNYDSKTFRVTGQNDVLQYGWYWQEVRSYDRSTPGTLVETRVETDYNATVQKYRKFYYTTGQGQDKVWTRLEAYDLVNTNNLISSSDFDPGLTVIKNIMTVGQLWTTHSVNNWFNSLAAPEFQTGFSGRLETRSLVGMESVTANNVVYDNCIKILRVRHFSSGSSEELRWYCEGQGLVKRMDNSGRIFELVSTTP